VTERYVVIIESSDGGTGHVCENKGAVADLVRRELTSPDSEGVGLVEDEHERMESGLLDFLASDYVGGDQVWWVMGCDRWKERATIAILTENPAP